MSEQDRWVTKIPLQMFVGELDDWTPAAPCIALTERARAAGMTIETMVYRGAYHDFDAPDMPVHQLSGIATTASGHATIGTEPTARADVIKRAPEVLARYLKP